MSKIELKNVGPIDRLEIEAEPGRVVVLRGPNGSGKTTALGAVSRMMGGNAKLSKRDGALNGSISGGGVLLRVTASGTGKASGKLEFEPVDEDLTVADIVDPNVKDPVAADRKRIEAACALLGLVPEVEKFRDAMQQHGVDIDEVASDEARDAANVVEMAKRLKRDADSQSRVVEEDIRSCEEKLNGLRVAVEGVDMSLAGKAGEIGEEYLSARDLLAAMRSADVGAKNAAKKLQEMGEVVSVDVAAVQEQFKLATNRHKAAEEIVAELRDELKSALEKSAECRVAVDLAAKAVEVAEAQEKAQQARQALGETVAAGPTAEQLANAETAVTELVLKRDQAVVATAAKEKQDQIADLESEVEALRASAESFRAAGREVVASLGGMLGGTGLTVDEDGRLLVEHPKRGVVAFAELSEGERWETAISIVAKSAPEDSHGVFVLPQAAWQDLDETARAAVVRAVSKTKLTIIAAEAAGHKGDKITVTVEE